MIGRTGIRWKTLAAVMPLVLVGDLLLTTLHTRTTESYLTQSVEQRLSELADQVRFTIARGYEIDDSRSLYSIVRDYAGQDANIFGLTITKAGGEITADLDADRIFTPNPDPDVARVLGGEGELLQRFDEGGRVSYRLIEPIQRMPSTEVIGALDVEYDATTLFAIQRRLRTVGLLWSFLLVVSVGFGVALLLERSITGPLGRLTKAVAAIEIDSPRPQDLPKDTTDEIRVLADTFEKLVRNLRRSHLELRKHAERVQQAYDELKEAQMQVIQSEKMASLGLLTAGIAHEINNPMNFVAVNLALIEGYWADLRRLLEEYEKQGLPPEAARRIEAVRRKIDYESIPAAMETAIADTRTGARRTIEIVCDLRDFSRADSGGVQAVNLNQSIDTTLKVLKPRIGENIEIVRDYGDMPSFRCNGGHMNQVFMNILMNSIQAIGEEEGKITIRTRANGEELQVEIRDTGHGIPPDIASKVFDPFFTTKEVGQGTGLGLGISFRIVEDHGGRLSFESEAGKGTCMFIRLPLTREESHGATAGRALRGR